MAEGSNGFKDSDILGVNEAARYAGVARQTLYAAVEQGNLLRQPDGKFTVGQIRAWRDGVNPNNQGKGEMERNRHGSARKSVTIPLEDDGDNDDGASFSNAGGGGIVTMAQAKLDSEIWKAKLAELKYMRELGQFIPIDEVERVAANLGKMLQTKMYGWVPRFMAHMTDTGKETVKSEVRELIEEMLEELANIAGQEDNRSVQDGSDTPA